MATKSYLAIRLRDARKFAKLNVDEAGAIIGRSGKSVSAWEAGISEPSPKLLITICKAYDVPISFFFPPDVSGEAEIKSAEERLLETFDTCSPTGKQRVIEYAEMIAREFPGH